jgi:hypothetical protein
VKKLTGGFDNGLGAILIGEHSLASFLSKKSPEGISGLFQQYRPKAAVHHRQLTQCERFIRPDVGGLKRSGIHRKQFMKYRGALISPP